MQGVLQVKPLKAMLSDHLQSQEALGQQGNVSDGFRKGEFRVRRILLGDPESPTLAEVPNTWAK